MAKKKTKNIENQLDKFIEKEEELEDERFEKGDTSKNELIEKNLSVRYEFRNNIIKSQPEFRIIGEGDEWTPISDYHLNIFWRELNNKGKIKTSTANIRQIIESDYAPFINPVEDYFSSLAAWEPGMPDYIQQLADSVVVKENDNWNKYLRRWLIAFVANACTNYGCQNHTMLVLSGPTGCGKSTWLDKLCPEKLKSYWYNGKIDPNNKDAIARIADYVLINIDDQLKQINKKDENDLKNLITLPFVKFRRNYDKYDKEYPHLASFVASVDCLDFLTDPAGSRRFLCFEVETIDKDKSNAINRDNVYAQALYLFNAKERHWFEGKEIEELNLNNSKFQMVSKEEQLITEFYKKPEGKAEYYLTTTSIQSELELHSRLKLSTKLLGAALKKNGYSHFLKSINGVRTWVYAIDKISEVDREVERTRSPEEKELEIEESAKEKQNQKSYKQTRLAVTSDAPPF